MNWLADYKTLLFNNEVLHLLFFFLFFFVFLHPIQFWLPTPNNLSPLNDMQMNFHEPHDPKRWLNWDDISCHAAATVAVSVCLLAPYLDHLSWYPRQRPTGDIKGVHCHPSHVNFYSLASWKMRFCLSRVISEKPSPSLEHIKVYREDCGPQVTTTTSDNILQQYTISGVP